jgi:hypothetical protein
MLSFVVPDMTTKPALKNYQILLVWCKGSESTQWDSDSRRSEGQVKGPLQRSPRHITYHSAIRKSIGTRTPRTNNYPCGSRNVI